MEKKKKKRKELANRHRGIEEGVYLQRKKKESGLDASSAGNIYGGSTINFHLLVCACM